MEKKTDEVPISQSLIKSLFDYVEEKECGHQFREKFIVGRLFPSSPVQKMGQWFEYMATGALPKDGLIPMEDKTKSGDSTAPYQKIRAQLKNWQRIVDKYKIDIVTKGRAIKVFDHDLVPNPLTGVTDLEISMSIPDKNGNYEVIPYAIGDIKTSGLLYDKWNEFGWAIERLSEKQKLILQPIHYKFIRMIEKPEDPEPPFFFFLFSNTNEIDHRIIRFNIDTETEIANHRLLISKTRKELAYHMKRGFAPLPEVSRCSECILKTTCKDFIDVPKVEDFYLDTVGDTE